MATATRKPKRKQRAQGTPPEEAVAAATDAGDGRNSGRQSVPRERVGDVVHSLHNASADTNGSGGMVPPGLTSTTTPAGIAAHDPDALAAGTAASIQMLPPHRLERHPANRHPSAEAITECAASLAATGQLEPIVVRLLRRHTMSPDDGQHVRERYQIISGETRWLAAQRLEWQQVAVRVVDCSDAEALRLVAEFNSHRTDLDPIQRARLIEQLCLPIADGGGGLTREQAARSVGLESVSAASNLVRLLTLPDHWQQRIAAGELPQTWARAMLAIADDEQALAQADQVWHVWRTREDVTAFVAACCDAPTEHFPETVEPPAAADDDHVEDGGDAPAQPSSVSMPVQIDAEYSDANADAEDEPGEESPDSIGGGIASVASAEPVAISERLRGAVEEWRTMWLSHLVHDALPDWPQCSDRLFTWLASLGDSKPQLGVGAGFDLRELFRAAAEVGCYASYRDCWDAIANRNDEWRDILKLRVCQAFLAGCREAGSPPGIAPIMDVVLGDLAHLMGLRLKDCWRELCEDDPRCMLPAFLKFHTLGELADLGRMVACDVSSERTKQARINALLGRTIALPPYLRDWSL